MLPNDFPPWQTVYWWFRRFVRRFLFQTIHDVALMLDRERVGREASPTGGVVDSQSVKAPEAKTRGYDAGKRIVGRKRHIAVDTDGRLLMVNLTPADISDSAGAQMILDGVRKRWPWLKHLFADGEFWRLGSRRGSLCSADGQERPVFRRIVANQAQRKRGNRRSPGRICRSPLRSDDSMGSKGREARRARLASSRVKARRPLAAPSSWSTVPPGPNRRLATIAPSRLQFANVTATIRSRRVPTASPAHDHSNRCATLFRFFSISKQFRRPPRSPAERANLVLALSSCAGGLFRPVNANLCRDHPCYRSKPRVRPLSRRWRTGGPTCHPFPCSRWTNTTTR